MSVPVLVVQMLSNESVWLNCAIGVDLGHVHVINKVDEFLSPRRTIVAA